MKTIFLVQPWSGYMEWFQGSAPPLALLHAAVLARARYRIVLWDSRTIRSSDRGKALVSAVEEARPILVGFTSMIGRQVGEALRLSRCLRACFPDLALVWGGTVPSLNYPLVLSEPSLTAVVHGEGEETLLELADALASGQDIASVPGVMVRREGRIAGVPRRPIADLDALPVLDYTALPKGSEGTNYKRRGFFPIETSRGCPHSCAFCYNPSLHGRRWRVRSPARVGIELDAVKRVLNPSGVFIVDDNFFVDRERAFGVAEEIARRGLLWETHGITPDTAARLDEADLNFLVRSGCQGLKMGVESISASARRFLGKRVDPDRLRAFNERSARAGLPVEYSFMSGFPGQTENEVQEDILFALTLLRENPFAKLFQFTPLYPLPGTRLSSRYRTPGGPKGLEELARIDLGSGPSPWMGEAEARRLMRLQFASLFLTTKNGSLSWRKRMAIELARRVYRPIAERRMKAFFFDWMPEEKVYRVLTRMM